MYNHTRRLPEIFAWLEQACALPDFDQQRFARHARLHRGYSLTMQNRLPESERELQTVLDGSPGETDPLMPLGLTLLASAVGNQARVLEMEQLSRRALILATEMRPEYDYDCAEAYWQMCCAALFAGTPDVDRSLDYLAFARQSGMFAPSVVDLSIVVVRIRTPHAGWIR